MAKRADLAVVVAEGPNIIIVMTVDGRREEIILSRSSAAYLVGRMAVALAG